MNQPHSLFHASEEPAGDPTPAPAYHDRGDEIATPTGKPCIVTVEMGYGHLRPAYALAKAAGCQVLRAEQAPLSSPLEQRAWNYVRLAYESLSRASSLSLVGKGFGHVLASITKIPPLYPLRDLSPPEASTDVLRHLVRGGLGRVAVDYLRQHRAPLVTTFYSPALVADYHGYEPIYCVVTDSDVARVWAPFRPAHSHIHYLVPSQRLCQRLRAYGVAEDKITLTGFPLPHELVGGMERTILKRNLAARLVRLDPEGVFRQQYGRELSWELGSVPNERAGTPVHIAFAVGGAGSQADLPRQFLPGLKHLLTQNRVRITLIAGIRPEVRAAFEDGVAKAGLTSLLDNRSISIEHASGVEEYLNRFSALLADVDVLWTKPSELSFYGALGLPVVIAPPVGVHEEYNRRWLLEHGVGLVQRDPACAGDWLWEWLCQGHLAAAAWAGYKRLPSTGLYRILEQVGIEVKDPTMVEAGQLSAPDLGPTP